MIISCIIILILGYFETKEYHDNLLQMSYFSIKYNYSLSYKRSYFAILLDYILMELAFMDNKHFTEYYMLQIDIADAIYDNWDFLRVFYEDEYYHPVILFIRDMVITLVLCAIVTHNTC